VEKENPNTAFFIINDPFKQNQQIQSVVKKGFMVRTRSDADTVKRAENAKSSGAQLISTDYYLARLSSNGKFEISFEGGTYTRHNAITIVDNRITKSKGLMAQALLTVLTNQFFSLQKKNC
jgi:hypothetical protein